jgi:hypothetical protein
VGPAPLTLTPALALAFALAFAIAIALGPDRRARQVEVNHLARGKGLASRPSLVCRSRTFCGA